MYDIYGELSERAQQLDTCNRYALRFALRTLTDETVIVMGKGVWQAEQRKVLAKLDKDPVAPLDAIAAGAKLADTLGQWQALAVREAREQGATWVQIGEALDMTEEAAREYWREVVERASDEWPSLAETYQALL